MVIQLAVVAQVASFKDLFARLDGGARARDVRCVR
jgi:hypothetical protein